jgi:hypothetical protein
VCRPIHRGKLPFPYPLRGHPLPVTWFNLKLYVVGPPAALRAAALLLLAHLQSELTACPPAGAPTDGLTRSCGTPLALLLLAHLRPELTACPPIGAPPIRRPACLCSALPVLLHPVPHQPSSSSYIPATAAAAALYCLSYSMGSSFAHTFVATSRIF